MNTGPGKGMNTAPGSGTGSGRDPGSNRRRTGAAYESLAAEFLRSQGFSILERNFRTRAGEIDLIAMDGGYLCFIEVKYRKNDRMGMPAESVGIRKQRRILAVSQYYLSIHHLNGACVRYDVVEIVGDRIRVLKDCFGGYRPRMGKNTIS